MDTRLVIALAEFVVGFNNIKRRRIWVKKYRRKYGHLPMLKKIRENYPEDFKNYLRMDGDNFDCLLERIRHRTTKQNTVMRKCITPEARLSATLRYLATGRSFEDLKFSSGISTSALSKIIPETCKAIYETLREDYMRVSIKTPFKFIYLFNDNIIKKKSKVSVITVIVERRIDSVF